MYLSNLVCPFFISTLLTSIYIQSVMKTIISVVIVVSLAGAVTTGAGASSTLIRLGKNTEIIYDKTHKTFIEINFREYFIFASNAKFLLVLNIKTKLALIVDTRTRYAVHVQVQMDFMERDSLIYAKLLVKVDVLLTKFHTITSSAPSCFNFNILVDNFYKQKFDLHAIYKENSRLVTVLTESCGTWFRLIQQHVANGILQRQRDIWGFFAVLFGLDIQVSLSIMEIIRVSSLRFGEIDQRIMSEFIRLIRTDARSVLDFSTKLSDVTCLTSSANTDYILGYVNDSMHNPIRLNLPYKDTSLPLTITTVESKYIIHFTLHPNTDKNEYIQILYLSNVLFIFNVNNNIAMTFHQRSFILVHLDSVYLILCTSEFKKRIYGVVVYYPELAKQIRDRSFPEAATTIKALVNQYKSTSKFSFTALREAVLSRSAARLASIIGPEQASDILSHYGAFFQHTSGANSTDAIATGLFVNEHITSSSNFVAIINNIANTEEDPSALIDISITIPLLDRGLGSLLGHLSSGKRRILGRRSSESVKNLDENPYIVHLGRPGGFVSDKK